MSTHLLVRRSRRLAARLGSPSARRRVVAAALLLGGASTGPLGAQPAAPDCQSHGGVARPISVVASGGVSKGAYQAGALWALLQYERALRERAADSAVQIPGFAGASAGNLNALLGALEWATPVTAERRESHSMLWRTWVEVGTSRLIPAASTSPGAVTSLLDARAFDSAIGEVQRLASAPHLPCRLVIGITMTRADDATPYPIRDIRDAQVLRHALVVEMVTGPTGVRIQAVSRERIRPSSGVTLTPISDTTGAIPMAAYIEYVKASAAFPLAFAPRRLEYVRVDGRATPSTAPSTSGVFLDGAIFDNEPLSLGLDLVWNDASATPCETAVGPSFRRSEGCRVAFVSPNHRRGALSSVRGSPVAARGARDTGAAASSEVPFQLLDYAGLLLKVIGSAADYELFSLERRLQERRTECAPSDARSLCFMVTSRLFPIFGEKAGAFGAFLGRPLRELDFFIGVYDGLVRAVDAHECESASQRDGDLTGKHAECVRQAVGRALLDPAALPELSATGHAVLVALAAREFGDTSRADAASATQPPTAHARELLALFGALERGTALSDSLTVARRLGDGRAIDAARRRLCPEDAALRSVICDDGLLYALHDFRSAFPKAIRDSLAERGSAEERASFGDAEFATVVRDPDLALLRLGRRAIERVQMLEREDGWELGQMGLRAVDFLVGKAMQQQQRGVHASSSAAFRTRASLGAVASEVRVALTPMVVSGGTSGTVAIGWQPFGTVFGLRRWSAGLLSSASPVTSVLLKEGVSKVPSAGLRLESSMVRLPLLGEASVVAQGELCLQARCRLGPRELSVMVANRSLGVGVRRLPLVAGPSYGRRDLVVTLYDVPALLGVLFGR